MLKLLTITAATFVIAFSSQAYAQDAAALPAACSAAEAAAPMADKEMGGMAMGAPMDDAHKALMAGMDQMNTNMMAGAANPDIDVAFVCGMLPHHQGAITMAKAELQYGKDEWTKALAQQIITAQEKEIADMTKWLEDHAK